MLENFGAAPYIRLPPIWVRIGRTMVRVRVRIRFVFCSLGFRVRVRVRPTWARIGQV